MNPRSATFQVFCLIQILVFSEVVLGKLAHYKPLSEEGLMKLRNLGPNQSILPFSGQYQGDILISPEQMEYYKKSHTGEARIVLVNETYRWRDKTVPYQIRKEEYDSEQIELIKSAIREIEKVSCLTFPEYDSSKHPDFITVSSKEPGCFSNVGRQGGEQILDLMTPKNITDASCMDKFTIVHEFLHALGKQIDVSVKNLVTGKIKFEGFGHMHSAADRDDYVDIAWDKIMEEQQNAFDKYGADEFTNYDFEYDYGSVMHYPDWAFSIDGSPTIIAKKPLNGVVMGQAKKLSDTDIRKINKLYCEDDLA